MKITKQLKTASLLLLASLVWLIISPEKVLAEAESTTPSPALSASADISADNFVFIKNGDLSKELKFPVYEWSPKEAKPIGMILAIHGLTLHGMRYELLGKAAACSGYYLTAPDMNGFGLCREEKTGRQKINYEKSYEDIVLLAQKMKQKFPGIPLIALGESLGSTMAVKLAAGHPELVQGIILSAPAARINPTMFLYPSNVWDGFVAFAISPKFNFNLNAFMNKLVSNDPRVNAEMIADPLVTKHLTLIELLRSESFVGKTVKYAKKVAANTPVLILQGNKDHCVVPEAIVKVSKHIHSGDQTLRWLDSYGHLLLETNYMRPQTVDALTNWLADHEQERLQDLKETEALIRQLGGKGDD